MKQDSPGPPSPNGRRERREEDGRADRRSSGALLLTSPTPEPTGGADEQRRAAKHSTELDPLAALPNDLPDIRSIFSTDTFYPTEHVVSKRGVFFRGNLRGDAGQLLQRLSNRLALSFADRYTLSVLEGDEDGKALVLVEPSDIARQRYLARKGVRRWPTPEEALPVFGSVMFFTMTLLTVIARAALAIRVQWPEVQRVTALQGAAHLFVWFGLYAAVTQAAQRWIARRNQARLGIPMVLPSYEFGTFGVISHIDRSPPTRAAVFDIAAAGSGIGLIGGLLLFMLGLVLTSLSIGMGVDPSSEMLLEQTSYVYVQHEFLFQRSFLLGLLARAFLRLQTVSWPQAVARSAQYAGVVMVHPLAFAGASLVLVAALGLVPLRQLDGWRIVASLYGRRTASVASRFTILFLLIAAGASPHWLWFLVLVLFGPWRVDRHARDEVTEPDDRRTWLGFGLLLLMALTLTPFPKT
ncbi:hypothetical protein CDCA_CDCA02G0537 [Cyanidium caldarium]|uniref:Peptidase M50 domain-containing protein n=1 Tax=Cyanidium caldarium TaxID=2771 RepID=A0AAV9IQF6_CYACA|nr:hypothetical protein CDCA_CDCA02G0537 [Cyanidium caldarium]